MPSRIQRKRSKNWRMPEDTVYVGRPTKWGNPFTVTNKYKPGTPVAGARQYWAVPTIQDAIECYREMFNQKPSMVQTAIKELGGKNLACFCPLDQPCHVDVLLEIANPVGLK